MWRTLRIATLLVILLFVALNTYFDRVYSTDWDIPLRVALYPINADGSDITEQFIRQLSSEDFEDIEQFFDEQARRYGVTLEPAVRVSLAPVVHEAPPMVRPGAGVLSVIWWSLRARYWAWRAPQNPPGPRPDVKLFVLYHDPQRQSSLPHSIGVQKGLFGIVNVFADHGMAGSNDVVIAHELLHTLGATDKYELGSNLPRHPEGFAEPERDPLYPQAHAELMGGRIPRSENRADIPESLLDVVIGPYTASEIGWSK